MNKLKLHRLSQYTFFQPVWTHNSMENKPFVIPHFELNLLFLFDIKYTFHSTPQKNRFHKTCLQMIQKRNQPQMMFSFFFRQTKGSVSVRFWRLPLLFCDITMTLPYTFYVTLSEQNQLHFGLEFCDSVVILESRQEIVCPIFLKHKDGFANSLLF